MRLAVPAARVAGDSVDRRRLRQDAAAKGCPAGADESRVEREHLILRDAAPEGEVDVREERIEIIVRRTPQLSVVAIGLRNAE